MRQRAPHKRRKRNALYEHDGKALTLRQWSALTGINQKTIAYRMLRKGMSIGEAIDHERYSRGLSPKPQKPFRFSVLIGSSRVDIKITPGVVDDFARPLGTGGGSTAQETSKISFPELDPDA